MDCTTTSSPRKCRNCGHDQFDEDGDCAKCHEPASPPASKPNRSGSKSHIDVAAVKQSASGRWPDILERVAGIPAELLDGKNHPCPKCGGTDRFRMIDQEAGAVLCNQCFSQYNGDGIAAIRWMLGIDFAAAVRKLCDYLGMASGGNGKSSLNIVATYNYCDERGELMYQVCRLDPKDFRQRAPKPSGGWTWTTKGLRRIPYRLPELLAADKEQLVVVPEGEKDVDNCRQRGLVATCNAGGAGKWRPEYAEFFVGRKVCVIADRDEPGDKHGQQVAATLRGKATSVKVIEAPGDGKDVSDYFAAGGTVEELLAMAESAPEWQPTAAPPAGNTGGRERGAKKENQATVLVDMAIQDGCIPWHDADGIGYATIPVAVPVAGHIEHWPLRSKAFRRWLCRQYYLTLKSSPNAQALQDALGVLDGIAQYEGKQHDTAVRVAEHEGNIYIDLCDAAWRAVEITPDGWSIVANPPVRFRRAKAMLPLPEPVRGGHVDELRGYVNVSDDEWPLVVAWLLASYRPTGPYPVLCLHGEQGSGKSTQARALRGVIDPNSAPLRSEPKEPRDMMIASSNGWIVSYDNLSRISAWLSDALCRLSSGGGFSTRELYSDAEETIFDAARPVILTGIEELATRSDLLDRSIVVTLPTIQESLRRPESELWAEYRRAQPRILGAMLDAVAEAIRVLPTVRLDRRPRMADFALWAAAGEQGMGLPAGAVMGAYAGNRAAGNDLALESSPVARPIMDMLATAEVWTGTASELLAEVERLVDERTRRSKWWPASARALSGAIKRLAPNLRAAGVDVDFSREPDRQRRRLVTFARNGRGLCVHTVHTVRDPGNADANTDGSDANTDGSDANAGEETRDRTRTDDSDAKFPPYSAGVGLDDANSELTQESEVEQWTA